MKSQPERLREFVDYHINGDGECNGVVLSAWADKHKLGEQERYDLAVMFSMSYCVPSAIVLFERARKTQTAEELEKMKNSIIFQSDRKYMRMSSRIQTAMRDYWENHSDYAEFMAKTSTDGKIDIAKAVKEVQKWKLYGRFSAFLFIETLARLLKAEVVNASIDWKQGDTATSGLLNLYGLDKAADVFDSKGKLIIADAVMDEMLSAVKKAVRAAGGEDSVVELETSLCAYRKFYKGTRYNGYYLDRMLEDLHRMRPEHGRIVGELFEIRAECYRPEALGEKTGWNGIRKSAKRLYRDSGVIMYPRGVRNG